MAYDKVIDSAKLDADLTTVADAIRSKGGTSEALAFPSGFVSAIEAIEVGSGESAKTTSIDYSSYSSGTFVETLDTGEDLTYTLTLDSEGKPTQIATPDGDTVTVEW